MHLRKIIVPVLVENLVYKLIVKIKVLLVGTMLKNCKNMNLKKVWFINFLKVHFCSIFILIDYAVGFGGKFGVQSDRQDKSAVGWDNVETVEKHQSQVDHSRVSYL